MLIFPCSPPTLHALRLRLLLFIGIWNTFGPTVEGAVIGTPNYLQILRTVIRSIVILVVDIFASLQRAPKGLFHHIAMLPNVSLDCLGMIWHSQHHITKVIDVPTCPTFHPLAVMPVYIAAHSPVSFIDWGHFTTSTLTWLGDKWGFKTAQCSKIFLLLGIRPALPVPSYITRFVISKIWAVRQLVSASTDTDPNGRVPVPT